MFTKLQQIVAANLALDTSTLKCIMLHRTNLMVALQHPLGVGALPSDDRLGQYCL